MTTLPMDSYEGLQYQSKVIKEGPIFYHAKLTIDKIGDTYFNCKGWHRGHILVNGYNIGRFWEVGPEFTIYVPAPVLRKGENDIVLFDQIGAADTPSIISQDYPILG